MTGTDSILLVAGVTGGGQASCQVDNPLSPSRNFSGRLDGWG